MSLNFVVPTLAAVLLGGCVNERVGTEPSPIGNVDYEGTVLRAVRHTLSPAELSCPLKLITADNLQQEEPSNRVASAKICAYVHKFSVKQRYVDADGTMIVVKRID